jgi:hypothetical protein
VEPRPEGAAEALVEDEEVRSVMRERIHIETYGAAGKGQGGAQNSVYNYGYDYGWNTAAGGGIPAPAPLPLLDWSSPEERRRALVEHGKWLGEELQRVMAALKEEGS